jgi:hypothetical protein
MLLARVPRDERLAGRDVAHQVGHGAVTPAEALQEAQARFVQASMDARKAVARCQTGAPTVNGQSPLADTSRVEARMDTPPPLGRGT